MRIIGGQHRGLRLASVGKGDIAAHLRPTTDRVRENLFNVLLGGRFGDPVTGARVLDLFAGTGALGLEALSRGAAHVTFVDDGRKAQALIRDNIALLQRAADCRVITRNALKLPPNDASPFEMIFLDPPYGQALGEKALAMAIRGGWIAEGALAVWEENTAVTPPEGWQELDRRRYGDTHIHILRAA